MSYDSEYGITDEFKEEWPIGTRLLAITSSGTTGIVEGNEYEVVGWEKSDVQRLKVKGLHQYIHLPNWFVKKDGNVRGTVQLAIHQVLEGKITLDTLADDLLESITQALNKSHNLK